MEREIQSLCSIIRDETLNFETDACQILKEMKKEKEADLDALINLGSDLDEKLASIRQMKKNIAIGCLRVQAVCDSIDDVDESPQR